MVVDIESMANVKMLKSYILPVEVTPLADYVNTEHCTSTIN